MLQKKDNDEATVFKKMSISFERRIENVEPIGLLRNASSDRTRLAMAFCCIGATIGDAIGSPFENKQPHEIEKMWDRKPSGFVFPSRLSNLGLIYTDDTQMSISLIESYLVYVVVVVY